MSKHFKIVLFSVLALFAAIGLLFSAVFVAMQFGLLNVRGSALERNSFFTDGTPAETKIASTPCTVEERKVCPWNETPEWEVVAGGLQKDAAIIARVEKETGVSGRLIAAVVIPEQIRFFTSEREVFKRYFEPLKILGSLSQFSLGVSGIKQETAKKVEEYAQDPSSPFYPGPEAAVLLSYPEGVDKNSELFRRLTDDKDHYYSYLYTALYLKEIQAQWRNAGFPINENPEALVTLFNIGFTNSRPNPSPQPGGAPITVGGTTYAFGTLGAEFYRSSLLTEFFPR
ncbi:hypothetical protein KJ819_03415 [Patescibacteria group bacterium]|nr:hypothetical protein [Patescibacteria group bacterium]MBU1500519.1 hypothetical protein [Patescibacteria group bacterium]MBU2080682.1 hypothetical protein [Patescibacteria group bacterium]MBU2123787.1 hypothetical protein [Patescibacteria group bacterium]MBU2194922.1 hypothetical protein [Patescibacteria group bacterium]